jgi:hypothetical protein
LLLIFDKNQTIIHHAFIPSRAMPLFYKQSGFYVCTATRTPRTPQIRLHFPKMFLIMFNGPVLGGFLASFGWVRMRIFLHCAPHLITPLPIKNLFLPSFGLYILLG